MDLSTRMNNIIADSTNQAAKIVNAYGKPKYIAAIIEIIISAIAIIGIQIVAMGFDYSKLIEPQFWFKTFALTLCIFLLYRAVINVRFEKTENRQSVLDIKNEYTSLVKEKELDLSTYLENVFNVQTKISVYVSKINEKIYKLERKRIKAKKLKKKQKYQKRIDALKDIIDPEYITKTINYINVKYYVVYYDDFADVERYSGNGNISTRGTQDYYKAFNISSIKIIWMYFIMAIAFSISIWTFGDSTTIQIISNILSSIIMISTRMLTAFLEADKIYDSTITASYVCKIDILKRYFKWKNENTEYELKNSIKPNEYKPITISEGKIEVAN